MGLLFYVDWFIFLSRRVETALESFSRSIVDLNAGDIVAGHSASQTSLKQVYQFFCNIFYIFDIDFGPL